MQKTAASTPTVDPGFAPAKTNLTLHLEGRRDDGYHLLRSLVVFAEIGDRVCLAEGSGLTLNITGPFAADLSSHQNLVLRAAETLASRWDRPAEATLTLEKLLPVAAGIGGGSSDAAATLRLLSTAWQVQVPSDLAAGLGADVPVCLAGPKAKFMSGIGEIIEPAPSLPPCWLVLVNPRVGVATSQVFAEVVDRNPPPGPVLPVHGISDFPAFRAWLAEQRNDLQEPASKLCPVISDVLAALRPAPLARMSGSGATCFGLFPDQASAENLAARLSRETDWWVAATAICR